MPELIGKHVRKRHGYGAGLEKQTRKKSQCAIIKEKGRDEVRLISSFFVSPVNSNWRLSALSRNQIDRLGINVNKKFKSR